MTALAMTPEDASSPPPTAERLWNLHVLILEADIRVAQLTRAIFTALGINRTNLARDSEEALLILRDRPVDIFITEWDTRLLNGLDLTRFIRTSKDSPNPMIPIIMATQRVSLDEIQQATNSGIHEFLPKPFSPRALFDRLNAIIDNPRGFVLAQHYTGPDRRRQGSPPPGVLERRGHEMQKPEVVTREQLAAGFADSKPRIILPDYSLKQKIERAPASMAGIETILSREQAAKQEGDYIQWIMADIATIRQSLKSMLAAPQYGTTYAERVATAAMSIRSRALSSDFTLGAKVAAQLHDFCRNYFRRDNRQHPIVIEKHAETLTAIFGARLIGDGGEIGEELFNELVQLVRKYI